MAQSSHSNAESNCVEVTGRARSVAVRDSKDAGGPALAFRPGGWTVFVRRLKTLRTSEAAPRNRLTAAAGPIM